MSDTALVEPTAPISLRDHIAVEEPKAAPPADVAVLEAPVDPDVQAEIDKADPPTVDETPQQRAARTKRNQAIADKAIRTRLSNRAEREKERADRLEGELAAVRRGHSPESSPAPAPPVTAPAASFPKFEAWLSQHEGQDYDDYQDARVVWRLEQDKLASRASQSRAEADSEAAAVDAAYRTRIDASREKLADFDAVTSAATFTVTPAMAPTANALIDAIRRSEHGPELSYHFAKDPAAFNGLLAKSPALALVELGTIAARLSAPPAPAAPTVHVSSAPAPHDPSGGGAPHSRPDLTKVGASARDHYAVEQAEINERQRQGHRY